MTEKDYTNANFSETMNGNGAYSYGPRRCMRRRR